MVGFCPGKEDIAGKDGSTGCGAVTGLRNKSLRLSLSGEEGGGRLVTVQGGGPGGVTVLGDGETVQGPRGGVEG